MRISDWSSDVCSSDLTRGRPAHSSGSTAPRRSFSLRRGRAGTQCHSSSPGLPEVTTCAGCVASAPYPPQHARMRFSPFLLHPTLRPLLHTLLLSGAVTRLAVALPLHFLDPGHLLTGSILLLDFPASFLSHHT